MLSQTQSQPLGVAGESQLPPRPIRPPRRVHDRYRPPAPLVDVDVDPEVFLHRRNRLPEALGKFRRRRLLGREFFFSNDYWAWYIPSGITFWIVVGNIACAWPIIGWLSFLVVMVLVGTGFTASYLVTCTDPGIYPRLRPGETDPLAGYEGLVLCRVCQIRRPPRTSHCYQCNVCVLEHDHHCGVIGGCVGVRSLRWFTLFLVCQSTACCIGVYWVLYFFISTVYDIEMRSRQARYTTTTMPPFVNLSAASHFSGGRLRLRRTRNNDDSLDIVGVRQIGAIFMLLIDFVIILLVGGLAVMYVYLTVSSTTRRESQKRETSCGICFNPGKMLANIKHAAFPPASLVATASADGAATVAVDEAAEVERLV